jgi:hypothetical protein
LPQPIRKAMLAGSGHLIDRGLLADGKENVALSRLCEIQPADKP